MALDTPINRHALISVFPDLAGDNNFRILSDVDPQYNCIAWAMGYTDRWVDIDTDLYGHWWPDGVTKSMSPEALVEAFEAEGFEPTNNAKLEKGYSKVVLYCNESTGEWTHAARIITDHIEHSKFGQAWDGEHSHDVLQNTSARQESQSYGSAYAYMRRKSAAPAHNVTEGKMTVNLDNLCKIKAKLGIL